MAKQIVCCVPNFANYKVLQPFDIDVKNLKFTNYSWNGPYGDTTFTVRLGNLKAKLGFQVNGIIVTIPKDIVITMKSVIKGYKTLMFYFHVFSKNNGGLTSFKFNLDGQVLEGLHLEEV